jgi:hypothetical protein
MGERERAFGAGTQYLAGYGLRDPQIPASLQVPDKSWGTLISEAAFQRLTGLAVAANETGHLSLTKQQTTELLERHEGAMIHALSIERHLVHLAKAFAEAGISPIVLKGSAFAHTFYPDPSWRPFGDLDLLVRSEDWLQSCELLVELGHHRRYVEPRAGFTQRFGRTALHISKSGLEVDLHRALATGPYLHWIPAEGIFEHTAVFEVAGSQLRRLDDTAAFLHACVHASLGSRPPLLMPLRDVAQIASCRRVDWEVVRSLAAAWKLQAVVRHALATASAVLDVPLASEAAELKDTLAPERKEHGALAAFTTERRERGARDIWALRTIPGLREKVAYAWAKLVPDRTFLASTTHRDQCASYVRRWRNLFRRLKGA